MTNARMLMNDSRSVVGPPHRNVVTILLDFWASQIVQLFSLLIVLKGSFRLLCRRTVRFLIKGRSMQV